MFNGIIANPDVLEEDYIPESIPCREVQKREIRFCLLNIEKGRRPLDCICHGKPGTGKTTLVKFILKQINENTRASAFYVNCWECKTLNAVLDRLIEQAHIMLSQTDHSIKIKRLKEKIGSKACVIALDEIDKLDRKNLNDVLYLLKSLGKVGIIGISNTRRYLLDFDPRVTSRISFNSILFPPYSNEELKIILKHRILDCKSLYSDTWSEKILEKIADLSAGDARVAIQTLRNSAHIAEKAGKNKISEEDVDAGYEEAKEIKRKYELEKLSEHHRIIFDIIKDKPGIMSNVLFDKYKDEAMKRRLEPKSMRSVSNYVNELVTLKYVKFNKANLRGNVRSFFLA
jgi:cell division control protein 6